MNPYNKIKNLPNRFHHTENAIYNIEKTVGNIALMSSDLVEKIARIDNNPPALQMLSVAAMAHRQQLKMAAVEAPVESSAYKPAEQESYDDRIKALEVLAPNSFPKWLKLFENGRKTYENDPRGSCAIWGDIYAEGFRNFCSLNVRGRVLDIGSGPLGKPFYLQNYPSNLISAVEPLKLDAKVDFEVVRAFNEALPWPDNSFHSVINSTSLDHVLSLDKALEETHRVMTPDGKFIVWIGSISGAKPYDPHDPDLEPIDEFHLFHIDKIWFEPYIEKWFRIEEKLEFTNASFTHIYYVFSKR